MLKVSNQPKFVFEDEQSIKTIECFYFQEHKALFIETSAKDGTNASETLIELARYGQDIWRCFDDRIALI